MFQGSSVVGGAAGIFQRRLEETQSLIDKTKQLLENPSLAPIYNTSNNDIVRDIDSIMTAITRRYGMMVIGGHATNSDVSNNPNNNNRLG